MVTDTQDGVYGTVTGTVGRTFGTRNGDAFEIEVAGRGEHPDKWTVWATMPVTKGDRVTVKGHLTARLGSYQAPSGTKYKVERSVNGAELVNHQPITVEDPWTPPDEPPTDAWTTAPIPGEDAPF